jgi:hypothetical protein
MKHLFSKLWYLCSGIYFGTNQCFRKKRKIFIADLMICDFQNLFTNHQPFVVRFPFDHTKILTLLKRNTHIKVYCHSIKFQKPDLIQMIVRLRVSWRIHQQRTPSHLFMSMVMLRVNRRKPHLQRKQSPPSLHLVLVMLRLRVNRRNHTYRGNRALHLYSSSW